MNCNSVCSNCSSNCKGSICPICGNKGILVPLKTVKSLINDDKLLDNDNTNAYLCKSRKCGVIYFFDNLPNIYMSNDVKVKIWFKSPLNEYLVCYCNNIFLTDIINIVENSSDDNLTKKDIFKILKIKEDNSKCIYNNPIGQPCDKLFENAIDYAYKLKNRRKEN